MGSDLLVGTRARDLALITHCARRTKWARAVDCRPSPFLDELPDRNVCVDALPKGAAGARRARRWLNPQRAFTLSFFPRSSITAAIPPDMICVVVRLAADPFAVSL